MPLLQQPLRGLAFIMDVKALDRWWEVDCRTHQLLERTFGDKGPPVRYYWTDNFWTGWDDSDDDLL